MGKMCTRQLNRNIFLNQGNIILCVNLTGYAIILFQSETGNLIFCASRVQRIGQGSNPIDAYSATYGIID